MANACPITNKTSNSAGGYSNRTRATQYNPTGKRRQKVNLQKKKIYVPETDEFITLKVSAKGLKIIQKKGAYRALKDAGIIA
ncbi:MAG: 50S ribosomal protein L28 [Candidatus Paceibacterota bacterium]